LVMGLLKDNIHIDIHIDNLVINFPCEKPEDEEALRQEIMDKLNKIKADIESTIS
jgi:sensor domain CHASE-containing protein